MNSFCNTVFVIVMQIKLVVVVVVVVGPVMQANYAYMVLFHNVSYRNV